jgi:hypothetical protein
MPTGAANSYAQAEVIDDGELHCGGPGGLRESLLYAKRWEDD